MTRSEPGVCFDESPICRQHAKEGKCTNTAFYHYANYCKRSCGLCEFAPSPKAECNFPDDLQGYWVMFSDLEREEVAVEAADIIFSTFGKFTCKGKHWESDYYKVFSVFQNGCRPRYSCIRLSMADDSTALIDISSSDVMDRSFQLCDFDDPKQSQPISGGTRNWRTRTLLPLSSMLEARCGLSAWLKAEAVFSDGLRCPSHVWDVSPVNCEPQSLLTVSLTRCRPSNAYKFEFTCTALVKINDEGSLLVTHEKSNNSSSVDRYICWMLKGGQPLQQQQQRSGQQLLPEPPLEMNRVRCDTTQPAIYSRESPQLVQIAIFRDQSNTQTPCSLAMKETMDDPRTSQTKQSSDKALHKPTDLERRQTTSLGNKTPSGELQSQGLRDGDAVQENGSEQLDGGAYQIKDGAKNSRIRTETDEDDKFDHFSEASGSFGMTSSRWTNFCLIFTFLLSLRLLK